MTDLLTPKERSRRMSLIQGRNTGPELALRRALRRNGITYRSLLKIAGVTVDIVLPAHRTAIFVHGCFWHGCPQHYTAPKVHAGSWREKLETNIRRDRSQVRPLARVRPLQDNI